MPFWRKDTPEEIREKAAREAAIKALESGEIPPIARERIERERKHGSGFFTSDLSCREYLFMREAGFRTLGQVMGSSFFRVRMFGGAYWRMTGTAEMQEVTQVLFKSRKIALDRMKHEAQLMGASGVVGVRITERGHSWAGGLSEFTAIGTAISIPGWSGEPFTSALNGQEFWQLYQAGYRPRAMVMGVCSYYIFTDQQTRQMLYTWLGNNNRNNQEVNAYTQGFYRARELAMSRLLQMIRQVQADGVIGVTFTPEVEAIHYESSGNSRHDLVCNFVIEGTAISKSGAASKPSPPLLCLNLGTNSFGALGSSADWDYDTIVGPDTRIDNTGDRDDD